MYPWIALMLAYLGFLALALGMPRHAAEILGRTPGMAQRHLAQGAGGGLLLASAMAALQGWTSTAIALSAWAGQLTLAAFALAMVLTYGIAYRRVAFAMPLFLCLLGGMLISTRN